MVYNFYVSDAETGSPVEGASCSVVDRYVKPREGAGCITGADGRCSIDALFPANYYTVYKAGYVTESDAVPGTEIAVALQPTAVEYWVIVNPGAGGTVDPSGSFQVPENTKLTVTAYPDSGMELDHWIVNGSNAGNTNPLGVVIDRDSFTIYAIFKESMTPEPPDGETWPVTRRMHLFSNHELTSSWHDTWKRETRLVKGVDLNLLLGGKIDYSVTFLQGNQVPIVAITWNEETLVQQTLRPVGTTITGSADITGLIVGTNSLTIAANSIIGAWNSCIFDVWLTLGYSDEPTIEPGTPPEWIEWLEKNWKLLALSAVGLTGVYLFTRKGPPVVVLGGGAK